jgi:hypothetical protein
MFVPLSLLYTVEEVGVLQLSLYVLLDPLIMSWTDRLINDAGELKKGDLTREIQIVGSFVNVLATIYLPPFSPRDLLLV